MEMKGPLTFVSSVLTYFTIFIVMISKSNKGVSDSETDYTFSFVKAINGGKSLDES